MVKYAAGLKVLSRFASLRRALLLLTCGLAVIGPTPGKAAAGSASGSSAIVDLPVAFGVENANTSGVPCPSDGAHYTVRGDLVGPRWAFEAKRRRAVTVYLHGINVGAFMWRLPGFPELDHAASLARRGHVSLVIDQMGYDSSDHSHGWLNCLGSQADMTRQLVERLRTGSYAVASGEPVSFQTVVLAGHDTGATIADIVAYSYPGAIDALVHFSWADQGFTMKPQVGFAEAAPICASGGQPAEQGPPDRDDPTGGPSGYVQFLTDPQIREEQFNTEEAVVDRLLRMVNRNPCGQFSQIPAVLQINTQRLPEIEIPVLYGYTDHEFIWTQEGLAQQAQHYRNSRDLTTVVIRDAGHFPNFSRVASNFQSTIARWLSTRGFVSTQKRGSNDG
jgi:pimeloyl-ACP methyl ester carboxylesterase